ncbi:uncharacterized protein B0I36DRAFT_349408 [Microdochium trichocladiopsis]|uniref:Uncharacterized protein n=1 Tax=Microdochium trichocladiopsis TaxID=1682393 RepID=A0A9P8Y9M5_9PEZI|nr:uncharacterized protein B0I36DRAFT_349408 [Microdochium trichocladiopsis]KAH7031319.1 hypothetical protein B0I36DRAFT_349408 [Microdochium trichocladiopsis]
MAPAYLIGSWMVLAGHVLASAGHHHHAHLHHARHLPISPLPVPTEVLDFGRAAQTTSPATLGDSCGEVNDAIVGCADIIPNFDKADAQQIGQCLCCDGTKYRPKVFDGKAAQCASYIKGLAPQSTDAINQWAGLASFCGPGGPEGNMAGVCTKTYSYKSKAPETIAAVGPAVTASVAPACLSLQAIGASCMKETPGFGSLPAKSQAECYCYSSTKQTTTWIPGHLDNFANKCANWASGAGQSSLGSAASHLVGFCSSLGDFLGSEAPSVMAAAATPTLGLAGHTTSAPVNEQPVAAMLETSAPARTGPTVSESLALPTTTSGAITLGRPASWVLCAGAVSLALFGW